MKEKPNLTLEEHKMIAEFFRVFHDKGHPIFELLKKRLPRKVLNQFARGVNSIGSIKCYCTEACESDCRKHCHDIESDEWEQWRSCYENITGWCVLD